MSPQTQILVTGTVEVLIALALGWCAWLAWKRRSTRGTGVADGTIERRRQDELLSRLIKMVEEHAKSVESFQQTILQAGDHTTPSRGQCDAQIRTMRDANRRFEVHAENQSSELQTVADLNRSAFLDVSQRFSDHRQKAIRFDRVLGTIPAGNAADEVQQIVAAPLDDVFESTRRLELELAAARRIVEEQAIKIRAAEEDARIDPLTRIPNRRAFEEHLDSVHSIYERKGVSYSLLILDIDKFKLCNDTYGHAAGDAVLQVTAKVVQAQLRLADRLFRLGGEEFAMVLSATGLQHAAMVAERVRKRVEASVVRFEGRELQVTISVGVAEMTAGVSRTGLIERADAALYEAKDAGRNRIQLAHCESNADVDSLPSASICDMGSSGASETK